MLLSVKRPTALFKYWLAGLALELLHHFILHTFINMAVGKLSRGSLSHNKGYKPDGRKAYARAALKCMLHFASPFGGQRTGDTPGRRQ
jgi:hypothetical protein